MGAVITIMELPVGDKEMAMIFFGDTISAHLVVADTNAWFHSWQIHIPIPLPIKRPTFCCDKMAVSTCRAFKQVSVNTLVVCFLDEFHGT